MRKFKIWEVAVYQAREIESLYMHDAVVAFADVPVLHLSGDCGLSTKNNIVRWIASDGSAREFHAYEITNEY